MLYMSKAEGTGGRIKASPEAFVVKEIAKNGTILERNKQYAPGELGYEEKEGKFCVFVLEKRDWTTTQALKAVANKAGRGARSTGYAGMKDKVAITTQLASLFGATKEQVLGVRIKDISIGSAWNSNVGIGMGELLGNAFEMTIDETDHAENAQIILDELNGAMPNYFDKQRFGARLNNDAIGLHIMKGEHEEAVMEFLTYTGNETNEEAVAARKRLAEERDFKAALSYFPQYLKYERSVIDYMARYDNPAMALRKMPKSILLMFVHAVEDGIFNKELDIRIKEGSLQEAKLWCGKNFYGFPDIESIGESEDTFPVAPLIGYDTDEEHISEHSNEIMDELEISRELFKVRGMPDLSMKGTYRALLVPVKDCNAETGADYVRLSFSLPAGSYATVLAGEIMKNKGTHDEAT